MASRRPHDVPEHAKYIEIGSARAVTMKTNLCHRVRQCTVPVKRGEPVDPLGDFGCL